MRIAGIVFQQTAVVRADLVSGVMAIDRAAGSGEWVAYELLDEVFAERWFRGAPGSFEVRHALSWRGNDQWEVCEPVRGPSVWRECLDYGATGIHHVGAFVQDDLDAASAKLEAQGWKLVQQASGFGRDGDGEFRYFEHQAFPVLAELITPPARRRPELPLALRPTARQAGASTDMSGEL